MIITEESLKIVYSRILFQAVHDYYLLYKHHYKGTMNYRSWERKELNYLEYWFESNRFTYQLNGAKIKEAMRFRVENDLPFLPLKGRSDPRYKKELEFYEKYKNLWKDES